MALFRRWYQRPPPNGAARNGAVRYGTARNWAARRRHAVVLPPGSAACDADDHPSGWLHPTRPRPDARGQPQAMDGSAKRLLWRQYSLFRPDNVVTTCDTGPPMLNRRLKQQHKSDDAGMRLRRSHANCFMAGFPAQAGPHAGLFIIFDIIGSGPLRLAHDDPGEVSHDPIPCSARRRQGRPESQCGRPHPRAA
jgi:hypothetical protein